MTNYYMQRHYSLLSETQQLREQIMDILTDADLDCHLGGDTMTLGALCREMGEVEHSYIESLKTGKQDWSYRVSEPGMETSVEKLKRWYKSLDEELYNVISGFTDDELKNKIIDRGFSLPAAYQIHVYREALLIFAAKASIYLKVMQKTLPEQVQGWIG